MKDDVKVKVPNGNPQDFNSFKGGGNWDGVLKFGDKLKGAHVTYF